MSSTNERRIRALVILLTLVLHAIILCSLFIFTRKDSYEPLRITAQPQFIEYLLNNLTQQQNNSANPTLPSASPSLASAMQQLTQPKSLPLPDEDGYDEYMLKNAVSYGSYSQGSVVSIGQENGDPNTTGNSSEQLEEQPEPDKQDQLTENTNEKQEAEQPAPEQNDANDQAQAQEESSEEPAPEDNSTNEPQQTLIDPMSGMSPSIAQAEDILNNTGSSWITPPQSKTPSKAPSYAQAGHQSSEQQASQRKTIIQSAKTPQRKLTMADITRGYVKHMRQEQDSTGHCTYSQAGSPSGAIRHGAYAPPTSGAALSEQIYASKLYNLLEQSAQAYSSQIYSCHDLEMETMIEVTIEKSGRILDVALKPKLPEKDMEEALCLIVKRVGLFPPIPKQFHKQRIILSIPIRIKSKQGFASYRLLYGISAA